MARKYKIITPDDRRAIERAYLEAATVDEIAAEVGVARSTISTTLTSPYRGDTPSSIPTHGARRSSLLSR